ncbi:MAG: hypothetical protein HYY24_11860 [Verrucomicrobia bacterium]|nr:hypothetical protein [Verrucomicrobiota bacterium]
MNSAQPNRPDEEPHAPAELVEALKSLHRVRIFVPPSVDEAVLAKARAHLAESTSTRGTRSIRAALAKARAYLAEFNPMPFAWRPLAPWAALAASLVIVAWLAHTLTKPASNPDGGTTFAREDLNQDGKVDILDALVLARTIEQGQTPGGQFDLNGDGAMDRRDAEVIAKRAVNLEKGGRS